MTVPQKQIDELTKRMEGAAGNNLVSLILYGSAASGEYDPKLSNLNIFAVLRDTSFKALEALSLVAGWWAQQKQPPFLVMSLLEVERSTDVFTIEFMDMKRHHRLISGDDVLSGLSIPMHLHRVHVEYELREKLVLLRQRMLVAGGDDKKLWDLLLHSVPSFATLCRHAAIALGHDQNANNREAIRNLASLLNSDLSAIESVLDVREHKAEPVKIRVHELSRRYLAAIEHVTQAVDQRFESGNLGHS
jgi:hypothetical protein